MRAVAWVVLALAIGGPAAGKDDGTDFREAIDTVRQVGRALAYANRCIRDTERIQRAVGATLMVVNAGRPQGEADLIRSALWIEFIYSNEMPKAEACADWIERLVNIERAAR